MNIKTTMRYCRSHEHKNIIKNTINNSIFSNLITNEMDKFLRRHNLPKLTEGEINNLNRPVSIKEIKLIIDSFLTEIPRHRWVQWWILQTFNE